MSAEAIDLLEQCDPFAALRNALHVAAQEREHWAGIPMPLEGERLVVEPTYPHAEMLAGLCGPDKSAPDPEYAGWREVNQWWSFAKRGDVLVIEKPDGSRTWGLRSGMHHLKYDLTTLGCAVAWGVEQEAAAIHTLAGLLKHHAFKTYMLTGMFLEVSKRSGLFYMFRRLKPTIAISGATGETRIIAALCLHPIAFYEGSWAGAMCPTDDVLAHLMLMRGDEAMFWRRANQHPAYRPEAGL